LLFLGRGATPKVDEDNRLVTRQRGGLPMPSLPMPPAFDIQGYIDGIFGQTATAPVQPPVQFFFPRDVVVTSSGVPAISKTPAEIITPTTKVAIGGDGGETIEASALAVKRTEQIAQQQFEYEANVQPRNLAATLEANRIEEARQKKFADDLIAKNRAAQLARNKAVVARTREDQERLAKSQAESRPPTINFYVDDDEWSMNPFATAGQPITIEGDDQLDFVDVDFTPEYSQTFEISGGMDSPTVYASEDEQPSGTTVHEITAQYDIGF